MVLLLSSIYIYIEFMCMAMWTLLVLFLRNIGIIIFQLGTLGAGNHYAEIQVVDEIYDKWAASKMGIEEKGQICVMIHSGSRGFGHQVATDALVQMEKAMKRDNIETNDRQLACARIKSQEGQDYLKAMAAAANFAWVNRSSMTFLSRQVMNIS